MVMRYCEYGGAWIDGWMGDNANNNDDNSNRQQQQHKQQQCDEDNHQRNKKKERTSKSTVGLVALQSPTG
jgi:isoaspartyl peptidase/L-asparaginase-like protein (Ntn-hydrolase superfamily)